MELFIPSMLVICAFSAVTKLNRLPWLGCYFLDIAFSDVMTIHFFFLVRNKGSWMEIGNSISHFGIMSAQVVFVLLLLTLTDIYTGDIHINSSCPSSRKAIRYRVYSFQYLIDCNCFTDLRMKIIVSTFRTICPPALDLLIGGYPIYPPPEFLKGYWCSSEPPGCSSKLMLLGACFSCSLFPFTNLPLVFVLYVRFSSGSEVANLLVASDLLKQSCNANSELYKSTDSNELLEYKISQHGNYSILAFVASPRALEGDQLAADLVSSSNLKETFPLFDFGFLCSKSNPKFSINKAVVSLFETYHQKLSKLKTQVVDDLCHRTICRDVTVLVQWITEPFESGIKRQLQALGVDQPEQYINSLKQQEWKFIYGRKSSFDPSKKLNGMKIYMAYLEFYKKWCKDNETGYYDTYKNSQLECDIQVEVFKKILTNYWTDLVKEVEKKPQRAGTAFRTRWLYGGTNYRRMVEPLDIADYYYGKKTNYESEGRSEHYIKLEEWLKEDQQLKEEKRLKEGKEPKTNSIDSKKENAASILTDDSQFWAKLEEVRLLKMEEPGVEEKLKEFENHVWGLLKNYAVSPEIFLRDSSFMKWWDDYKKTKGRSCSSPLWKFITNGQHKLYEIGKWSPPISIT
ncbi:hypothetical protein FNV43_RR14389 [Rhamnella rubrinervis]|uniref:Uncharacterized protein n=1 Tax=Rhamnella rubrinervis TaxID=2594499 RepID=A0A8K0MG74_9ROSA|nr:hypothetical protein FNV43_RR14389 [Rhamnella rubrinervis]